MAKQMTVVIKFIMSVICRMQRELPLPAKNASKGDGCMTCIQRQSKTLIVRETGPSFLSNDSTKCYTNCIIQTENLVSLSSLVLHDEFLIHCRRSRCQFF